VVVSAAVLVDSVVAVVSVDVVSVVDVSVDVVSVVVLVSLDVVPGSVGVVSVAVESERTASGPAPATTPAATSPAVNIVTSTKPIRTRCRPREAAFRLAPISRSPFGSRHRGDAPTPHSHRSAPLTRSQRGGVWTYLSDELGVRCYTPSPAGGESALFL
jgi:hypothetical protein